VEKESRIEFLRRQRILQGEKAFQKVARKASTHLDDSSAGQAKIRLPFFHRNKPEKESTGRPYPLSANELPNAAKQKKAVRIHIGWRFFSAILTMAFSACLLVGWQSSDFRVSTIDIKGTERISPEEVQASFNIQQEPIFAVVPLEITKNISRAFPEFKEIRVAAVFPNRISITLKERKPILAWKSNNGSIWVDEEGIIIPARGNSGDLLTVESSTMPIFSHPQPEEDTEPEMDKYHEKRNYWKSPEFSMIWFEYHHNIEPGLFNAILRLNQYIPTESVFLFDIHRGLGWNETHGWKIFVGLDLEKINEKMLAYEKIVSELTSRGIRPSLVSVEYLHAPYYRMD